MIISCACFLQHTMMRISLVVDPTFLDKLNQKDSSLDERLKNVYVTSEDVSSDNPTETNLTVIYHSETTSYIQNLPTIRQRATSRGGGEKPLPSDRGVTEDFEFGFQEPEHVQIGRCTLRQAVKFIYDHQIQPELWTAEKIAKEYQLNSELVGKKRIACHTLTSLSRISSRSFSLLSISGKILYYYKGYSLYLPDKSAKESILIQARPDLLADTTQKRLPKDESS